MSNVILSRTTIEDLEGFRHVQESGWNDAYPNEEQGVPGSLVREYTDSWFTPEALAESVEYIQPKINDFEHNIFYVAKQDGKVVGMSHGYIDDEKQELEALYVHKDYYKQGIGSALIRQVLSHMSPARDVTLGVVEYNDRAIRFYEKHGFQIIPNSNKPFQTRHPDLVLPEISMIRKGEPA